MVVPDFSFLRIKDFKSLIRIGLRVFHDLIMAQTRARFVFVRRIAYQCSKGSYDKYCLMTEILKLLELPHGYGMTEVKIRRRWVVSAIDANRLPILCRMDQLLFELCLHRLF